ncbi:MAG: NfeD-like protein [Leptolyngbyaceae cyanobacterium HOT.MB2.61]|nr:NfeD-like protein [Leptolyngbyaceae cyanobacterium HOT.MB2.61]
MLSIYWCCFAIGGVFVLLAVVGGLDGADYDIHFDTDSDTSIDADVELTDPGDRENSNRLLLRPQRSGVWPFLIGILKSLKFWTFGLCFFGLTGLVLSQFSLPGGLVAIAATGMGILCGALISGILQALRQQQVNSLVRANDLVGLTGTVELPFDATSRGKVRLLVKGTMANFTAYTDETKEFSMGEQVLVVGTEHNRLWVVSANSLDQASEVSREN